MSEADKAIEQAAKAMWDAEPDIYGWGPQERREVSWDEAVANDLVGPRVFRALARAAIEAFDAARAERQSDLLEAARALLGVIYGINPSFANGVTDSTGIIDEGEVRASEALSTLEAAIARAEATPSQTPESSSHER